MSSRLIDSESSPTQHKHILTTNIWVLGIPMPSLLPHLGWWSAVTCSSRAAQHDLEVVEPARGLEPARSASVDKSSRNASPAYPLAHRRDAFATVVSDIAVQHTFYPVAAAHSRPLTETRLTKPTQSSGAALKKPLLLPVCSHCRIYLNDTCRILFPFKILGTSLSPIQIINPPYLELRWQCYLIFPLHWYWTRPLAKARVFRNSNCVEFAKQLAPLSAVTITIHPLTRLFGAHSP